MCIAYGLHSVLGKVLLRASNLSFAQSEQNDIAILDHGDSGSSSDEEDSASTSREKKVEKSASALTEEDSFWRRRRG